MNVRTALMSSALLLAVLGWACEQGPTSPSALGGGSLGAAGGVSLDAASGVVLGVRPNCPDPDDPRCEPKGDGTTTFEATIIIGDSGFSAIDTVATDAFAPVPVDNKFNTGNIIDMNSVEVSIGGVDITLDFSSFSVRKRQGKLVSAKISVGDGANNRFATDFLPAFSPATILDSGFTLHVHAENAHFVRLKEHDFSVPLFTLNIGDIVYTPVP